MRQLINPALLLVCALLAQASTAQLDSRSNSGLSLRNLTSETPIPLEQAFPYYVSVLDDNRLRITWDIAPGHYLYRHAFQFSLVTPAGTQPVAAELPEGLHKTDQFFGEIEAYYTQVSAEMPVPATTADSVLVIQYQGCADWGFCYPPQRREFNLQP